MGRLSSFFSFCCLVRFANFLKLARMRFGVLRIALHQRPKRNEAGFGVVAGALKGRFRQRLQQGVVFSSQAAKGLKRLLGLANGVIQITRLGFLIESHERGIVLRGHLAQEVRDDLPHAPFAGRRDEILFLSVDAGKDDG